MKRWILFLSVVLILGMCTDGAYADPDTDYAANNPANGCIEVTCCQLTEGQEYVFMALKDSGNGITLNGDTILEIRQFTSQGHSAKIALIGDKYDDAYFLFGGCFVNGNSPKLIFQTQYAESYLPVSLTHIEQEAFMDCDLQIVYLGNGIASIGERAFKGCAQLRFIQIPPTVRLIADDAFEGCNHLVIGCRKNSLAQRYALNAGIDYELRI